MKRGGGKSVSPHRGSKGRRARHTKIWNRNMRVTARETAFKVIFASIFTGEISRNTAKALYNMEKLTPDDIAYADKVLCLVEDHWNEYSAIIDRLSVSFPEVRIFPADKSIMLLSLAEIYGLEDVPDAVSVNEAANIASKYSSEKSASFVSGILGEAIREKQSGASGFAGKAKGPAEGPKAETHKADIPKDEDSAGGETKAGVPQDGEPQDGESQDAEPQGAGAKDEEE